jgi:outer membrane immunogenic protein
MRVCKLISCAAAAVAYLIASAASAADLGTAPYGKTPDFIVPVYDWSGGYVGVNVGYGLGRSADTSGLGAPILFSDTIRSNMNGVLGGAQIGYNSQMQNWVVGLEADFQGTGQRSTHSLTCPAGMCTAAALTDATRQQLDFFGTVRVRAGFSIVPTVLLYGTAGIAYGQVDSDTNLLGATRAQNYNPGWTAGGGIEAAIGGGWSARVEYLYLDLGRVSNTFNSAIFTAGGGPPLVGSFSSRITDSIVRGGLNYKFSGPVIPKY